MLVGFSSSGGLRSGYYYASESSWGAFVSTGVRAASAFMGASRSASVTPFGLSGGGASTPCDSLEVILGELIAGGASGFSLSIAGLRRFLLGFVASGGGVGFGRVIIGHGLIPY